MGIDDSTGFEYPQFSAVTADRTRSANSSTAAGDTHDSTSVPLHAVALAERFIYQCSGPVDGVPVVYMPGVHGCWTPLGNARERLARSVRLIEVAYPLQARWTLDHHADELEHLLDTLGIESVHVIGESFGSLVGWQFGLSRPERTRSHILVGGFCRAPPLGIAAGAGFGLELLWAPAFDSIVDTYVAWKRLRGGSRTANPNLSAYPGVRGVRGQRAVANRMRLIQRTDFRRQLPDVRFPVCYLGGEKDRVVPVTREIRTLEQYLPAGAVFQSVLLAGAPHMIIASHPKQSVERIAEWIDAIESSRVTASRSNAVTGPERADER